MRPAQETIDISRDLVSLLPRLRRFALTLTRDGPEADDLVQAVCERATGRQFPWNGDGRLEAALYTLARTLWSESAARRKASGESAPALGSSRETAFAGPVQQRIIAMPEGLASVFLLVVVETHTYRETATILGLTPDAVREKLAAARTRLAAISSDMTERRA